VLHICTSRAIHINIHRHAMSPLTPTTHCKCDRDVVYVRDDTMSYLAIHSPTMCQVPYARVVPRTSLFNCTPCRPSALQHTAYGYAKEMTYTQWCYPIFGNTLSRYVSGAKCIHKNTSPRDPLCTGELRPVFDDDDDEACWPAHDSFCCKTSRKIDMRCFAPGPRDGRDGLGEREGEEEEEAESEEPGTT